MKWALFVTAICFTSKVFAGNYNDTLLTTPFEKSQGRKSATVGQANKHYKLLDSLYETVKMEKVGKADGSYPMHIVYYDPSKVFNPTEWKKLGKLVILVNNGIHAGEPDGIDASMMLIRDAANGKINIPDNIVLAVIPVYNLGGAMNRGKNSRANQNGPESYGFRGNAQNLDLNRDFVKCDAMESRTFQKLFHSLDPDIFIDNHVSDGADYQHLMTLLPTQEDKLGGNSAQLMTSSITPKIYEAMHKRGYDLVPYVNNFDNTPDKGWRAFLEPARFGSGYAALFQTLAYVPETHMLKPFKDRVYATYQLMQSMINIASDNANAIHEARSADRNNILSQKEFALEWTVDSTSHENILFKGYKSGYKTSLVSGLPRLYYDRTQPYEKQVPFYNRYKAKNIVKAPTAYIVPRAWNAVIANLKRNGLKFERIAKDTTITVTAYHIEHFEAGNKPYEKHFVIKNIKVSSSSTNVKLKKGDLIFYTNQTGKRYLIETLEPTAPDGFLAWNFFDGILQQKEYFSDYVFEDVAAEMLEKNAQLRNQLDSARKADPQLAASAQAQLEFVYRHSKYMEPSYMRYPIFRIE